MKIINAKVYTEAGIFEEKDVYTDGELIAEKSGDDQVLDAKGCYLIPGLTDIHFHGCVGHDFCDGTHESIEAMAVYGISGCDHYRSGNDDTLKRYTEKDLRSSRFLQE